MSSLDSFTTRTPLTVGGETIHFYSLPALAKAGFPDVERLPYSLKILLENLLRREDNAFVKTDDIRALAGWDPKTIGEKEMSFMPARVLLQDFTGVPCVVDLAAMRDGIVALGGDPDKVNPLQPVELVIDHSVQVDHFGTANAMELNADLEYHRNRERYVFLRWGQTAFRNFRVVPPETGIVHQVNIEYLARVVCRDEQDGVTIAYPDTVFGTDSHTTMVNGLGVVGWGVGGIEAEAAMLGQPSSMLIPPVLGYRLTGRLPEGATATDLVLTITENLRKKGVVGKFVEFYGPGLAHLTIADRVTLGNMCPEYGATVAIFPIDEMTLDYLRLTGRDEKQIALVEAYARAQGMFRTDDTPDAVYTETHGDGPRDRRAQPGRTASSAGSRVAVRRQACVRRRAGRTEEGRQGGPAPPAAAPRWRSRPQLEHGSVVIAAITSCTNTSNPSVMIGAGLRGEEGHREGPAGEALGEDVAGARLEGGHRLPESRGAAVLSRSARLQPGGLRLHHLHRQQRSAARRGLRRDPRARAGGGLGAERQPQLRGPHPAGRARQLPGLAAAGGGLRPCRLDERGPLHRAAGDGPRRPAGVPEGRLADASRRFSRRC